MKKALIIAEKPSLRREIEAVYKKHASEIPYEATFLEQRGHLLTLKMPNELDEELEKWDWDTLPIEPENYGGFKYKIINETKTGKYLTAKERYYAIRDELKSKSYDFIINAGDPDQEGELLIRIVVDSLRTGLPVKRLWWNDETEPELLRALKNLRDDDTDTMLTNLYAAAKGRQHTDYRFGMNLSRAASLRMNSRVALGRVKTPIMSIVCKREKEIAEFKPKTCYGIKAEYADGFFGQHYDEKKEAECEDKKDEGAGLVWFDTEEEATNIMYELSDTANVVKFEKKRVETFAPKLFKLATVQIAAGKLGYTSSHTLEIIQGLYERGLLSYPRTDSEYLASGENFKGLLNSAACVPELEPYVSSIDPSIIGKVKATKKWVNDKELEKSGHSALVPTTKKPVFEELSPEEQIIYTLICKQYVAIFLPPLVQDKTLLISDIDGYLFKSTGKTLVDEGYSKIFGTKFTDNEIPVHSEGDSIDVENFDIVTKTTTCPKRFTDADLIAVCEAPHKYLFDTRLKSLGKSLKIGTPATRASIIEELVSKNHYLQRAKEKRAEHIIPTDVGMQIYENLKDCEICRVDLTGELEEMLEAVRSGEMTLDALEDDMKKHVASLVEDIRTNTSIKVITKGGGERSIVCKCPSCGGDIISGPKSFYCSNFKEKECNVGAFKMICDSKVTDAEFAKLITGECIVKKIKKGSTSWEQKLSFNMEERKYVFVKDEIVESGYACPACGNTLMDSGRLFSCTEECGFKFWKTSFGKTLTKKEFDNFFESGDTGLVTGLKSKAGKLFNAHIVLSEDDNTKTKLITSSGGKTHGFNRVDDSPRHLVL